MVQCSTGRLDENSIRAFLTEHVEASAETNTAFVSGNEKWVFFIGNCTFRLRANFKLRDYRRSIVLSVGHVAQHFRSSQFSCKLSNRMTRRLEKFGRIRINHILFRFSTAYIGIHLMAADVTMLVIHFHNFSSVDCATHAHTNTCIIRTEAHAIRKCAQNIIVIHMIYSFFVQISFEIRYENSFGSFAFSIFPLFPLAIATFNALLLLAVSKFCLINA